MDATAQLAGFPEPDAIAPAMTVPVLTTTDGSVVHVPSLNVMATVGFNVGTPPVTVIVMRPPVSFAATDVSEAVPQPAERT